MRERKIWIAWLWQKFVGIVGPLNVLPFLLLLLSSFVTSYGISKEIRSINLGLFFFFGFVATLAGWLMARTKLSPWVAHLLDTVIALGVVAVRIGRLERDLWLTIRQTIGFGWSSFRYIYLGLRYWVLDLFWRSFEGAPPTVPPLAPVLDALTSLWTDLSTLVERTVIWFDGLIRGSSSFDPIASSLTWAFLVWIATSWAAWTVRRRGKPILAVMPLGILLGALFSYSFAGNDALLFLMGCALMLMATVAQNQREHRWEREHIDYSQDIRTELLWLATFITIGLMMTSAVVPEIDLGEIIDRIDRLVERPGAEDDRTISYVPASGETPERPSRNTLRRARRGGLPRRHLIGSGPELSEQTVMVISTGELEPVPPEFLLESPPTHHWRSATYDVYTTNGWSTGATAVNDYEAREELVVPEEEADRLLRQQVHVLVEDDDLVHVAGELVTINQPYQAAIRSQNDLFAATVDADYYLAYSLVPEVTVAELREVGTDYPDWITERYLQLPDGLPRRVTDLAQELTATEPTPYDRARAIEQYLRTTFPYTLDIPEPPINRDVVDYFLFDLQKGYCDYYATSMVVLARAAGLPARLVIGYATGTYNAYNANYIISEAEAHAWVDVYFPGYGWIEFEPTGGRPAIQRPLGEGYEDYDDLPEISRPQPGTDGGATVAWWWFLTPFAGIIVVALGIVAFEEVRLLWLRLHSPLNGLTRLYQQLRRWGSRLGVSMTAGDTPYEFAAAFKERMARLSARRRWSRWAAPAPQEMQRILEAYVQAHYSPEPVEKAALLKALRIWRKLRWRMRLFRFWLRFPTLAVYTSDGDMWDYRAEGEFLVPHDS